MGACVFQRIISVNVRALKRSLRTSYTFLIHLRLMDSFYYLVIEKFLIKAQILKLVYK